jgi:hypothetical protein
MAVYMTERDKKSISLCWNLELGYLYAVIMLSPKGRLGFAETPAKT